MTMLHEQKPSLEEALQHYGVKGMKWGVRRSQRELDRAAGRAPTRGKGRGPQIRDARASALSTKSNVQDAKKRRNLAATRLNAATATGNDKVFEKVAKDFAKAERDFNKAMAEHKNNPARASAARMTYGEVAVLSILTTPVVGLTYAAIVTGTGRSIQRRQRDQK